MAFTPQLIDAGDGQYIYVDPASGRQVVQNGDGTPWAYWDAYGGPESQGGAGAAVPGQGEEDRFFQTNMGDPRDYLSKVAPGVDFTPYAQNALQNMGIPSWSWTGPTRAASYILNEAQADHPELANYMPTDAMMEPEALATRQQMDIASRTSDRNSFQTGLAGLASIAAVTGGAGLLGSGPFAGMGGAAGSAGAAGAGEAGVAAYGSGASGGALGGAGMGGTGSGLSLGAGGASSLTAAPSSLTGLAQLSQGGLGAGMASGTAGLGMGGMGAGLGGSGLLAAGNAMGAGLLNAGAYFPTGAMAEAVAGAGNGLPLGTVSQAAQSAFSLPKILDSGRKLLEGAKTAGTAMQGIQALTGAGGLLGGGGGQQSAPMGAGGAGNAGSFPRAAQYQPPNYSLMPSPMIGDGGAGLRMLGQQGMMGLLNQRGGF
jgi:hypothetical protein